MDDLIAREILSKYKRNEYTGNLDALKKDLSRLHDNKIKQQITDKIIGAFELGDEVLPPKVNIVIHGIRTRAEGQAKIIQSLKNNDLPNSYPIQYDFFNLFKFWSPFFIFRRKKIKKVLKEIRDLKMRYRYSEFTIFAHSFGTYVISKILKEESDLKIDNLFLCGAIISDDYDWSELPNCPSLIINDCGTRDLYPVLAKGFCFGYGTSGRFGFGSSRVTDRFHNCGHSDFFNDRFIQKYLEPFYVNNHIEESEWTYNRSTAPYWVNCLASKTFNIICILLILATIYFI